MCTSTGSKKCDMEQRQDAFAGETGCTDRQTRGDPSKAPREGAIFEPFCGPSSKTINSLFTGGHARAV
jgi:hypothetical protein